MAATSAPVDDKDTILDIVFSNFQTEENIGLSAEQVQRLHGHIRPRRISLRQICAAMNYICASPYVCDREELLDLLQEIDRRYFMTEDLVWEFAMLDRQRKGAISRDDARFLFKMIHGSFFSQHKFNCLIETRPMPSSDISFAEIEVELCDIPTYTWMEDVFAEEEREQKEYELNRQEEERKRKEDEERKRIEEDTKLKMDEEDRKWKAELERRRVLEAESAEKQRLIEQEALQRHQNELAALKAAEELREKDRFKQAGTAYHEQQDISHSLDNERMKVIGDGVQHPNESAGEVARKTEVYGASTFVVDVAEACIMEESDEVVPPAAQLEAEKSEEARIRRDAEEKRKRRVMEKWSRAGELMASHLKQQRLEALYKAKAERDENEARHHAEAAGAAADAEERAELELKEAQALLDNAKDEESRRAAEAERSRALQEAMRNKEKRIRLTLHAAVKARKRVKIEHAVVEAKEAQIPALKPDIEVAESLCDSLKAGEDLEDAMTARNLRSLETAVSNIKTKGYERDHALLLNEADKLAQALKRFERLRHEISALDQRVISEIRSYKVPPPAVHQVMIAVYMILGYREKELKEWKFVQALLGRAGKESLKRMCLTLEAGKVDLAIAEDAERKYLQSHDLDTIRDVSNGAATFYVWATAITEEARSLKKDVALRVQIEERRKQELEEVTKDKAGRTQLGREEAQLKARSPGEKVVSKGQQKPDGGIRNNPVVPSTDRQKSTPTSPVAKLEKAGVSPKSASKK